MSRGQELRCAECQGKRVRPPSQAAIDAAIIAAQDRGDFGSMAPRAKRPKHAGQPSGRSAGTPGGVPDIAWAGTAAKVLAKVSRLPAAAAFCLPVDPEEVPDYHDVVRHPMDLGTLRDRVPRMASPLEVVAGINQIVENSVLYNGEDSEYTGAAKEMRTGFQRLWTKEGLPLNQQQWQEAKAAARRAAAGAATPQARVKTFTAPVPAGGVPAADWQARVARVLGTVSRLKSAIHFVEPVPRGFMNYHDVIERPMDLGTVSKRLARGQYSDPQQVAADVALIWRNCRTFNEPDAPVVQDCAHAEASFNRNWVNAGVYEVPGGAGPSGTHRLAKSSASTGADWKESAKKVLYRTINFVPQATWFAEPVSEADVPDYRQVIKHPMDLGTVSQKLRADRYSSPQELLADVSLIWANARQYNGPDHEVTKMAETTAAAMQRYWTAAGLPGVPTPRPSAFTSASNGVNDVGLGGAGSVFQPVRSGGPVGSSRAGPPSLAAPLGDWLSAARSVVDAVLRHPSAWPFAEPVDEEEYPEYRQMVAHPMDFGTIRMRLCRGQYRSPAAVLEDARLIFDNCKEFNPRESEVWSMGVEVEAAFKQAWLAAGLSQ